MHEHVIEHGAHCARDNLRIPTIDELRRQALVEQGNVNQAGEEVLLKTVFDSLADFKGPDETIRALKPRYQTDHLNSYLCDDPSNFFLLYGPLNRAFGFERLMGYKKKLAGDAWDGVVHFVKKAIEIEYGLYGSR